MSEYVDIIGEAIGGMVGIGASMLNEIVCLIIILAYMVALGVSIGIFIGIWWRLVKKVH